MTPESTIATTHPEHDQASATADCGARRRVIRIGVASLACLAGGALVSPRAAAQAAGAAKAVSLAVGDLLTEADPDDEKPAALKPADIPRGKPVLAFPYVPASGTVRDETRLNKLMLMRFDEAELDAATRARAAGGVIAFSAMCTHQGCDIKTWLSKEKVAVCFCHSSKFRLLEDGAVASGPALRALPTVPLTLVDGQLAVAGGFSAPPGGHQA
jgi:Rieske Fe-S protein